MQCGLAAEEPVARRLDTPTGMSPARAMSFSWTSTWSGRKRPIRIRVLTTLDILHRDQVSISQPSAFLDTPAKENTNSYHLSSFGKIFHVFETFLTNRHNKWEDSTEIQKMHGLKIEGKYIFHIYHISSS